MITADIWQVGVVPSPSARADRCGIAEFFLQLTKGVNVGLWTLAVSVSAAWGYQTEFDRSRVGH